MKASLHLAFALVAATAAGSRAQMQQPQQFEVASVKQNKLDDRIVTINVGPGGRFDCRGYTLVLLMQRAFGVMDWNVTGGPAWIRTDRFDITAIAPETGGRNLTESQLRPMLENLLKERFQLKVRETTREMPGYALIPARRRSRPANALYPAPESPERDASLLMDRQGLECRGISMADFARWVAGKTSAIAVDQTGLKGFYNCKVSWHTDESASSNTEKSRDEYRAIVFDAIEAQLGLKFERRKIPVRTLVIDHVEHPTAN